MSRPCVFCSKNSESDRNNDERRARQNQQSNPDQQDGYSDHGDNYTFNNLDVLKIPNAEEVSSNVEERSAVSLRKRSVITSSLATKLDWLLTERGTQTVKKRHLCRLHFLARDLLGEKFGAINFWKFLELT